MMKSKFWRGSCLGIYTAALVLLVTASTAAQASPWEKFFSYFNQTLGLADQDRGQVLTSLDRLRRLMAKAPDDGKYLFEVDYLQELVARHRQLPLEQAFQAIHQELLQRYPGRVAPSYRFIINDAGGALGQVGILYASTNEYLIFFGTPIANGGHSGRYNAEFYDIMIDGEMHTFIEGETKRHVYRPGDMAYLPRGQAKGYRIPDHAWMLEYARGNMVELFPFGVLAPAMFITLDWKSALAQISDFASLVWQNADYR